MRNIDLIREVTAAAVGQWPAVLAGLNIRVPDSPRKHTACPACGGTDRFRFDDNGRGSFICNQCGAGDGLDLIKLVNHCDTTEAAQLAADVLGIDYRAAQTDPAAASQRREQLAAERQQREQARQQQAETDAEQRRNAFTAKYQALATQATPGESEYLIAKGLDGFTFPALPDGSLLLALENESGAVTAAQTITAQGEKRLLTGSVKKGAYHAINATESPQVIAIGEGLATVLSVHLMRPEALAVVAIDAGNLLPVAELMRRKYPQAQIIIAADNDLHDLVNGIHEENPGKNAAEKAAAAVSGWVALPPTDRKADWNDYYQKYGLANATAAFNDSMYQIQGKAVKPQLQAIEGGKITARDSDPLKPYFDKRHGGLYYIEPKQNNATGAIDECEVWVSDEIETAGIGTDGKDGYLVIRMKQEGSGSVIHEAIPRREIGSPQGWARLRSRGVNITAKRGHLDLLANYLQLRGKRDEWTITHTAGWHDGAYVMPDGHIIGTPERPVAFCGGTSAIAGYVVRGTHSSWRENVASLMSGNRSMVLGALVAFAAPLNSLADGGSFGIHLFAQSSAGKTTTVEAASSIYGVPDELKLTWDATKYGLTVEAASRNDGFMPIDEIGQGNDVKHVAGSAYSLFNGTGRVQGHKDGGNKAVLRWAIVALSTGEEDFETYLIRNGVTPKAGQLVRLVSVPFTDTTEFHDWDDGDQHSRAIKRASTRHCGAVGREWIGLLADNSDAARQKVTDKENEWLANLPSELSPQAKRVAVRFALLDAAAELSAPLTGWRTEECSRFVRESFNEWLENYGTGNREKYQVVSRARDFIQRYGLSRFQPYTYGKKNGDMDRVYSSRITNLAGYMVSGRREDGRNEYHIIPSVFEEEILCGIQKKLGADALDEAGMLIRPEAGRVDGRTISIDGTQQRFVVLVSGGDD
ncbi:DUF927 domain-containing protein [Salmonella enterica subsp. enterica]